MDDFKKLKRRGLFRGGFTLNFKKFSLPSSYSSCNLVASSLPYPPRTGGGLCIIVGCIHTHASRRGKLREETYTAHVSYFSRYGEAISHPRLSPAQLLPSYAPSFWIHSYLSKRRRYGRICLHFPTMIERDFLEIVAVKLKRHGVIGGSVLILRLHFVASFEIYIPEILCVCHLGIWRKCIFLASSWWNLNL